MLPCHPTRKKLRRLQRSVNRNAYTTCRGAEGKGLMCMADVSYGSHSRRFRDVRHMSGYRVSDMPAAASLPATTSPLARVERTGLSIKRAI